MTQTVKSPRRCSARAQHQQAGLTRCGRQGREALQIKLQFLRNPAAAKMRRIKELRMLACRQGGRVQLIQIRRIIPDDVGNVSYHLYPGGRRQVRQYSFMTNKGAHKVTDVSGEFSKQKR